MLFAFLPFFLFCEKDRDRGRTRKKRGKEGERERRYRTRVSRHESPAIGRLDAIFVKSFSARSYRTRQMQARNYRPFWTKPIVGYLFLFISLHFLFSRFAFSLLSPPVARIYLRETLLARPSKNSSLSRQT